MPSIRPVGFLGIALLSCSCAASGQTLPSTQQEVLVRPVDPGITEPHFSPDGKRIAYVAHRDGKDHILLDGKAGAPFDEIPTYPVTFSPDGAHLAYEARIGKQWFVVSDERPSAPYDAIGGFMPLFSPDGKRVAFLGKKGDKQVVVLDGKEGPEYQVINYSILAFSPDSSRFIYNARKTKEAMVAVLDGKESAEYPFVGAPFFSPDSKKFAYTAMLNDGKSHLLVDGTEAPELDGVVDPDKIFRPGGTRLVEKVVSNKAIDTLDGKPITHYPGRSMISLSADGKHVAYAGMTIDDAGLKWRVVVDGKEDPPYDAIGENPGAGSSFPVFSPDGKHLAYGARVGKVRQGEKWLVVLDGKEQAKYDAVTALTFSADGNRFAYWAKKGNKWLVVVDGKEDAGADAMAFEAGNAILFSADGKHVAYKAQKGGDWVVVIDGTPGGPFEIVGPRHFNADDSLEYLGIKANALHRITWTPIAAH